MLNEMSLHWTVVLCNFDISFFLLFGTSDTLGDSVVHLFVSVLHIRHIGGQCGPNGTSTFATLHFAYKTHTETHAHAHKHTSMHTHATHTHKHTHTHILACTHIHMHMCTCACTCNTHTHTHTHTHIHATHAGTWVRCTS